MEPEDSLNEVLVKFSKYELNCSNATIRAIIHFSDYYWSSSNELAQDMLITDDIDRLNCFIKRLLIDVKLFSPQNLCDLSNRLITLIGKESEIIPGARTTLRWCTNKNLKLALLSNKNGEVGETLQKNKIADFFSAIVFAHELGVWKPNPYIFYHCISEMNIDKSNCLVVGDSLYSDYYGGLLSGIKTILIDKFRIYKCLGIRTLGNIQELGMFLEEHDMI